MTLYKWSQTASSNSNSDSTIDYAEGQAPSSLNNSARAVMAAAAKYRDDMAGSLTTGGTSTAYTLTSNQAFNTLANMSGKALRIKFHTANGASPTLNVDSLGAKSIVTVTGTAVGTGALAANGIYDLVYDNSSSEWILTNIPTAFQNVSIGGTLGVTGATTLSSTLAVTGAATLASVAGDAVASQAEQETGTSTTKIVTPGRLHFHQGVAKVWGLAILDGTPQLQTGSYNVTSVSDSATGILGVTIATDFSASTKASMIVTVEADSSEARMSCVQNSGRTAASFALQCASINGTNSDPSSWMFVGFGDI